MNPLIKYKNIISTGLGVGLAMVYDSYIFRKETCPYKNNYICNPDKYNIKTIHEKYQNNIYSSIMYPFRLIKDHYWIKDIHHKLIRGIDSDNIIRNNNYNNFLTDYPYPDKLLEKVFNHRYGLGGPNYIKPRADWVVEVLINNNRKAYFDYKNKLSDDNYSEMVEYLETNCTNKCNSTLVMELLWVELNYKSKHVIDPHIVLWCLSQSILYDDNILNIIDDMSDEMIDKIPNHLYNLSFIREQISENYKYHKNVNVLLLCNNRYYLKNMIEKHSTHLTDYLIKHNISSEDVKFLKNIDDDKNIYNLIDKSFDKFNTHNKIIISNYILNVLQLDIMSYMYIFRFLNDKENFTNFVKESQHNWSYEEFEKIYKDLKQFNRSTLSSFDFDNLINKGIYQIKPTDVIPNLGKYKDIIKTQKNLTCDQINQFINYYVGITKTNILALIGIIYFTLNLGHQCLII